jgi:methyl-accepting chemotaxis protein
VTAITEMSSTADSVAQSATETASFTRTANENAAKSKLVVAEASTSVLALVDEVERATERVKAMQEDAQRINDVLGVIGSIAGQTNLLALNAAIEAARAGESGRGFAVVADEVRKLAERTTASTQEIAHMVAEIQNGTRGAVATMEEGVARVAAGVDEARQAGAAMGQVREHAQHVVDMVSDISAVLREQSAAAADVARGIEEVAQMAEQNDTAVRSNTDTAVELERMAERLQADILRFKV